MNPKKKFLKDILNDAGFNLEDPLAVPFSTRNIPEKYNEQITLVYRNELDGKTNETPQPDLQFDIVFDNYLVELDDQLHFNRYRFRTLKSKFYEDLNGFPLEKYKRFCRTYERECIKSGLKEGLWTSPESEKYFGKPSEPGDFFANGSPGWKLKSFTDLLKDIYASTNQVNMIRIPIYDNLLISGQLYQIGKLLESRNANNIPFILNFINAKKKLVL